jgi:hypothetical protein
VLLTALKSNKYVDILTSNVKLTGIILGMVVAMGELGGVMTLKCKPCMKCTIPTQPSSSSSSFRSQATLGGPIGFSEQEVQGLTIP